MKREKEDRSFSSLIETSFVNRHRNQGVCGEEMGGLFDLFVGYLSGHPWTHFFSFFFFCYMYGRNDSFPVMK